MSLFNIPLKRQVRRIGLLLTCMSFEIILKQIRMAELKRFICATSYNTFINTNLIAD